MAPRSRIARSSEAAAAAVHVGHQQQGVVLEVGQVGGDQGPRRHRGEHRPHLRLRHHHGGQRRRGLPAGALGGRDHGLGGVALEEVAGDPLQQPLADPSGGGQLVGVPGDAGRGQLVDVGEDQLGEVDQRLGGHAVGHGGGRHLPPGDAGADPERREQGVRRPPAAGLAPAELVGALDGRGGRRTRVRAAAAAGQREEAAERELDGVADVLTHRAGQGALVAGDLLEDRGDGRLGHRGQARAHLGHRLGGQLELVTGGTPGGGAGHRSSLLFAANKCDLRLHARRTGLYAPR